MFSFFLQPQCVHAVVHYDFIFTSANNSPSMQLISDFFFQYNFRSMSTHIHQSSSPKVYTFMLKFTFVFWYKLRFILLHVLHKVGSYQPKDILNVISSDISFLTIRMKVATSHSIIIISVIFFSSVTCFFIYSLIAYCLSPPNKFSATQRQGLCLSYLLREIGLGLIKLRNFKPVPHPALQLWTQSRPTGE